MGLFIYWVHGRDQYRHTEHFTHFMYAKMQQRLHRCAKNNRKILICGKSLYYSGFIFKLHLHCSFITYNTTQKLKNKNRIIYEFADNSIVFFSRAWCDGNHHLSLYLNWSATKQWHFHQCRHFSVHFNTDKRLRCSKNDYNWLNKGCFIWSTYQYHNSNCYAAKWRTIVRAVPIIRRTSIHIYIKTSSATAISSSWLPIMYCY